MYTEALDIPGKDSISDFVAAKENTSTGSVMRNELPAAAWNVTYQNPRAVGLMHYRTYSIPAAPVISLT